MTKRLILMRHAKSGWDDPTLDDHDRPLNGRGRVSAQALGDWLRTKRIFPDQALVSSAARTRETFARLGLAMDAGFDRALYLAPPNVMMTALKGATGDTVLMIGHNPGIAELANSLMREQPNHTRFYDYPTCATLVAEFQIDDWAQLTPGSGALVEFTIPRELTG
ncbi:MAG: histidine phosphatase family protein [Roseovarius sp.]